MDSKNQSLCEPLIQTVRQAYPTLRKVLVYILVLALTLSPLFPWPTLRVAVLSGLGITLLFLLFDIYGSLEKRLAKIEECVVTASPPYFSDHRAAQADIYETIENSLMESPSIDLKFLTVSGCYSWPAFEHTFRRINDKFGGNKTFVVTFCLVEPTHFDSWSLDNWKTKAEATLGNIEAFKRQNSASIKKGDIIIKTYLFDNLPHWHGTLINNSVLFFGRTEWVFYLPEQSLPPDLNVGQIEYRKFTKSDRFGGDKLITRFINWIERYSQRDQELAKRKQA